jgi:hypothetical protein
MFKKWISKCFGINTDDKNNETICFNSIKKLMIVETAQKLPDINDKWKVIFFIDKANDICEKILGGTIEFIIQNPNEIIDKNTKSIKYKVNMFNTKTKLILNRLNFHFKYDSVEMGLILYIKPINLLSNNITYMYSFIYTPLTQHTRNHLVSADPDNLYVSGSIPLNGKYRPKKIIMIDDDSSRCIAS